MLLGDEDRQASSGEGWCCLPHRGCEKPMFVKDAEGRGCLSQVMREGAGCHPVARKGVSGHTSRCWKVLPGIS